MNDCFETGFRTYAATVPSLLDRSGLSAMLAGNPPILIKPNLINASPHPVTTHANCCQVLIEWLRAHCGNVPIVIAEGCGDPSMETMDVFRKLGYESLATSFGIDLLDLNAAPLKTISMAGNTIFRKARYPEIAFTHFIISVPVLKAHSLAAITGTLKNMIGFAPPQFYSGNSGFWRKAAFHTAMQKSITEWCRLRLPDFTLMDASVGLADFHLGGRQCEPPVRKILAGKNPLAVDRRAAELLALDWHAIGHLNSEAAGSYNLYSREHFAGSRP